MQLAAATRNHPQVAVGVSPRGLIALTRAASVFALSQGRTYIIPEDVKALAESVFSHRIQLAPDAAMRGASGAGIVAEVFEQVPVPLPASAT
ncbi:hypothetical protein GCM10029992_66460 [Glycomyces albus]